MSYCSSHDSENKKWAEENFKFFSDSISRYQFARGEPRAGNSKAIIAAALANRAALRRANKPTKGWTKINEPASGKQVRCQVLQQWHFDQAITSGSKLYYCSGSNRIGQIYADTDCHHSWQTPEMARQAQRIFEAVFPSLGLPSEGGANNWLKVDRGSYSCEEANLILLGDTKEGILGLQGAIQRVLAAADCWADFEIKGTFAFLDEYGRWQWGKYGKLPIHRPEWDRHKLQQLIDQPVVHIREIEDFIRQIEQEIPQFVLDEMNAEKARRNADEPLLVDDELVERIKKNWGERYHEVMHHAIENIDADGNWWLERKYLQPPKNIEQAKATVATPTRPQAKPTRTPADVRVNNVDLRDEPDAFNRQGEALRRFARAMGRVPNLEEALDHIQDQELYTGSWEGNRDRATRIKAILEWLRQTFDPSKIKKGSVQIGKHEKYVARKFPNGIAWSRETRWLDEQIRSTDNPATPAHYDPLEYKVRTSERLAHASAEFVAIFLDVVDYCLNDQPNKNGRFPTRRCERLWNTLLKKGVIFIRWCPRIFAACRETSVAYGIIRIPDRNFSPGKAMKWEMGRFFPGRESWKRTTKAPTPMTWSRYVAGLSVVEKKEVSEREGYNTLLHFNPVETPVSVYFVPPRGPP